MNPSMTIVGLARELLPMIPRREKYRFVLLLALALVMAISEVALAAIVALLAAAFSSPEAVLEYGPIKHISNFLPAGFMADSRLLALAVLLLLFGTILFKNALTIIQQWHLSTLSETVGAETRNHIFRFYQRMPFLRIVRDGVADLGFGLGAAAYLSTSLALVLHMTTGAMMVVTLFGGMLWVSPIPSLIFFVSVGGGGCVIVLLIRKKLDRRAHAVYVADYLLSRGTHLALHGLKEMRLYRRENVLFSQFKQNLKDLLVARRAQGVLSRLPVASLEVLGFSTLVVAMFFLIFVQEASMARISGIMGFLAATAWRGLPLANRLVEGFSGLRAGKPYLEKLLEILREERLVASQLLPLEETQEALPFRNDIRLENVSFTYPGAKKRAVDSVSLTIPHGSMVGLVGLSGSGKSTLVNLLTGLLPPEEGQIKVDGIAVSNDNSGAWLKRIGYVAQAPYIMNASLCENVALSRWGEVIDRQRVLECCRMAALDFLEDLPKGIDTVLGEGGSTLSGGQAQRVAIARALYNEPDLIIFDEATSALDMRNEKSIHETILSLRSTVTMVIIAHRLTTVEGCDTIFWLHAGKIKDSGSSDVILKQYMTKIECEYSID